MPVPRLQKGVVIGQINEVAETKSPLQPLQVPVDEQMGNAEPQSLLARQLTHWPANAPLETQSGLPIAGQARVATVPKFPLHG